MKKTALSQMILTAIFTSIICVFAQIVVPIGAIPVTLQTLGVGLSATFLGKKWGTLSVFLYLLIGLVLPVYARGGVGLATWAGPTGGFLLSFLLMAFVIGTLTEKFTNSIIVTVFSNILGSLIVLTIGTIWLKIVGGISWQAAFVTGAGIFIPIEMAKAVLTSFIAVSVKKAMPRRLLEKVSL